jgi:hypothetical protein
MRKRTSSAAIFVLLVFTYFGLLQGCVKGTVSKTRTYTYTTYTPVYQLKQSVLAGVNGDPAKSIDSLGKIYLWNNYIFLGDVDKGIHIIDNSEPSHPVQVGFLNIPGNQDIAIRGNILFADMYSDLLEIDISNLHRVKINSMLPSLFPDRSFVNGYNMDSSVVITSWIKKDTTVTVSEDPNLIRNNPGGPVYFAAAASATGTSANKTGVAGSTAKMVIINNFLYAITEMHTLGAIDITDPSSPKITYNQFSGFDLETIFPFSDKLFLGSDIGTFIYDISNPANPSQIGEFRHGQACDPVITDGNFAYITLHAGTYCGGASNELDVVNVQNITQPSLVNTYPMISPKGLAKDGNLLFVCDGPDVVKLFDATHPENIRLIFQISSTGPYDVIAGKGTLLVMGDQGLYQYDYSDVTDIRQLSFFPVKR